MDLKINSDFINENLLFTVLHDKYAGNFKFLPEGLHMEFWEDIRLKSKSSLDLTVKLKSPTEDCISIYCYRITDGKIAGTLEDISLLASDGFEIQIVEIGYMYSTVLIKGSIVGKDFSLNRNYILIKLSLEHKEDEILLKQQG